jgi:hypothetical protein
MLLVSATLLAGFDAALANCDFRGQTVREGQGVQAFRESFVPIGKPCESQTRTCRLGKLTGGYPQSTCKSVRFVEPADKLPFRRSDVMLTIRLPKHYYNQPWYDLYNKFHANRIVWSYAGKELLQDPRVAGRIPVQCTLEYWVPANHPQRDQMSCLRKDSSGGVLGYAEHPVYKLRIPDTNTKAWRDYALTKAKELLFLGCGSFGQDVPAIMATTRNTRSFIGDGCHSEESETLYKSYKDSRPAASYPEFMKDSVLQYHNWLHTSIRSAAKELDSSFDVYFGGNTSAASPSHLEEDAWFLPTFDFVQGEVFGDFSHNSPSKTVAELTRYLNLKKTGDHPVVLTLRSDSVRTDNVAYLRRATMSTYSVGMVPIVPWTASALTDKPLAYFFGNPADFSDIYKTVRTWPRFFDDFNPSDAVQIITPGKTENASNSLRVSTGDLFAASRSRAGNNSLKAVFIVNWGNAGKSGWIDLKKSDFPREPNSMIQIGNPEPLRVSAQDNRTHYRYHFDSLPEWAILFHAE